MTEEIKTAAEAVEAEALPRAHEVHCDPDARNAADQPVPKGVSKTPTEQKSPAQWAYERIIMYLKNFEESLDNEHEVAMGFTGGDAGVLRIEGMGYFPPDVVTFYGSDPTGSKTQLIQHVSQLNVMLRALPKAVEQAEPNRIGFRLAQDLEEE
ncbi:hypothetical protein GCM10007385_21950 [Tateyamaria omphalii]|uniref:DUF6173 family protein n=1 Tax=Tateyamaria omphalii TaxID=299262 RepID=UPI0016774E1E|nr:DUF6173 family protein [Tateyamaria omphalii]GGX53491.1 hypothetical protein GCM10007385_21950 [Tateyamaria omphalii]